jgi:O-antigen ligase
VRWLDRASFCALLGLIAFAAIPYGTVEPWWEAVVECCVFALGALWVIEGWVSGAWDIKGRQLLIPILALAAFAVAQTIPGLSISAGGARLGSSVWQAVSADPFETRRVALKLLALTLTLGLLLRRISSPGRLRALVHVVLLVSVASALFGLLRQLAPQTIPEDILLYSSSEQSYGQFINRNHFAYLMEMGLGLALGLIVGKGIARDRLFLYLAGALAIWAALVLSNSRGGIFSMCSQLLFLALLFSGRKPSSGVLDRMDGTLGWWYQLGRLLVVRVALIACLAVAVTASVLWVGSDPLVSRLESLPQDFSGEDAALRRNTSRKDIWHATWKLIKDNPIAGVGFGGYWIAIPAYHDASGRLTPREAHNDYLDLLASGGLIGAALGAWFVMVFIRCARVGLRSSETFRRAASLGALTGLSGVAAHSLVDFGLQVTVNALFFIALIVISATDIHSGEETPENRSAGPISLSTVSMSKY